jgi:hypothetical protein
MMPKKKKNVQPATQDTDKPVEAEVIKPEPAQPKPEVPFDLPPEPTEADRLQMLEKKQALFEMQAEEAFKQIVAAIQNLQNQPPPQAQPQPAPALGVGGDTLAKIIDKALSGDTGGNPMAEKMNTLFGNVLDKAIDMVTNGPPKSKLELYLEEYNAKKLAKSLVDATE